MLYEVITSVRSFSDMPVKEEFIQEILKCGIFAPSAKNKQNWHFSVVTNKEVIEKMNQLTLTGMEKLGIDKDPDYHVFYHAPLVITLSSILEGYSEINARNNFV